MHTVSQLIKLIKESFAANEPKELGRHLVSLIEQEPSRWMALLYMENIIPRPLSGNFNNSLGILIEAMQTSIQFDSFRPEHIKNIFLPLISVHTGLKAIVDRLDTLDVWEETGSRIIYRHSAFLEDQFRKSEEEINKEAQSGGYYNNEYLLRDNITTQMDGGKSNRLSGYEANCENLQLILSYTVRKYQEKFFGSVESCRTVYNDVDFHKLLVLASLWGKYEVLLQNVVFQNWYPQLFENDINIYRPQDTEEFLRSEIAHIRKQEMLYETALNIHSPNYSDTIEKLELLADSLTLPQRDKVWECGIDIQLLRESLTLSFGAVYADYEIYRHHYDAISKDVKLGIGGEAISWELYQKVIQVFRIIAKAFNLAFEHSNNNVDLGREFSRIAVVKKSSLIKILCESLDLEMIQADLALKTIIFSPALKNIEIWDTPFLEIDKEKILFVPALVEMGSPARALENIISQWNPDLFSKRGKVLELSLAEFLRAKGVKVQGPVLFDSSEGIKIECDLVVYWENYLILIEAKCTKDVIDPAEFFRAKERIEYAIEQLNYRKQQIFLNWDKFRLVAATLDLPETRIQLENIKLIAVTNVMHFTSWQHNGAIVTDEFCFRRFFGDADVESVAISNTGREVFGIVGRIRNHVRPTAREFFTYLENPPQVESIRKCLSLDTIPIPIINAGDPKIGMMYSTYHPERHPARIALKKLLGPKPKKRKRH